jgi:carbon monoxide dehydrogenase subunit G
MELEHSFTIPVPPKRAWDVLLDVEQVAPCMPGATLDSVDGDVVSGKIKVKVGPISLTYAGTARFTEKDEQAQVVALEASGKETRGTGTASATVRSSLEDLGGGQTRVTVHTTMNITGRPAQFGRGVMVEVGGKIIEKFAANLAARLATGGQPASAAGTAPPDDATLLPIEELNLPVRSYNSLRREGVHTVGALASRTENDLLAIDGLGPQSVREIRQKLADHGLALNAAIAGPADAGAADTGPGNAGPAETGPAETGPADAGPAHSRPAHAGPADAGSAGAADGNGVATEATGSTTQGRNGALPPAAAGRPADQDAIDLLGVAGVPVLKRALPAAGVLVGLLLALVLWSRRKRRRAAAE